MAKEKVTDISKANQTFSDEFMEAIAPLFEQRKQLEIQRTGIGQQIGAINKGIQADYHMNADAINDAYKYWDKTEQQKVNYDLTYHSLRSSIGQPIQNQLFSATINQNLKSLERNAAGDPENQEGNESEKDEAAES